MFNEGYVSRDTSPIIGLIIGEVSIKMWLYFVSVSMSVSAVSAALACQHA